MGVVYEYFTFDNETSRDYGVWISGNGTFNTPERETESVSVPGRNGDLHFDNGKFSNIQVTYPAFISRNFQHNFDAFKAFLSSKKGYKELFDTYDPDHFRLACYKSGLNPSMAPRNIAGSFDITFDCDPRRFLKSGQFPITITGGSYTLLNPTLYEALPLFRLYGPGTLTVGGVSVSINIADVYTNLDCEIQEAYKGSVSKNNYLTLTDGVFPTLPTGTINISYTGFSKVELTPRWWTI